MRGALDPISGTLVLFRFWLEGSYPKQRVFAIGIHRENDHIPYDVAVTDFRTQMEKSLAATGVQILGMKQALYGDTNIYSTEITLGFTEGTIQFLFHPNLLPKRIWTGPRNRNGRRKVRYVERNVEYRWPAKCRTCESEAHLSAACPWPNIEFGGRKPNLHPDGSS